MDSRDKRVSSDRPRLSVCFIVKNEKKNLPRALASVKGVADEIIVVDTGSTDATIDIAKEAGAKVFEHEWSDDFSEARNFALDQATGDWVLQLDADEELETPNADHVRGLLSSNEFDAYDCQIVNMGNEENLGGAISHRYPRLFRRRAYRYKGAIHETPQRIGRGSGPRPWAELHILHWGYMDGEARPERVRRNGRLLKNAIKKNPDDFLLYWYLGEHYTSLSRLKEALKCYLKAESLRPAAGVSYQPLTILRACECLMKLRRLDDAAEYIEFGIETFPDCRDLLFLGGHIFELRGDNERALQYFGRCAAIKVASPFYHIAREGLDLAAESRFQELRRRVIKT